MSIITVNGLYKVFQHTTAIKNIDLSVNKGEIFGIIGPDGAGKTTLLRLLTGILKPNNGSITVCDMNIVREPEAIKKRIGVVPQNFSLYPDLTVEENLKFFSQIYEIPLSEFERRRQKMLSITRLLAFSQLRAEKLSGGMQKKLALMCSLLHTPEVLILDEPTTGIDPVSRRELWDFLYDLLASGVTIIISTPYMDETEHCSRVGFLYNGEMLVVGTPHEIKGRYPFLLYEIKPETRNINTLAHELRVRSKDIVVDAHPVAKVLHVTAEKRNQHAVEELLRSFPDHLKYRIIEPSFEDAFISIIQRIQRVRS